MAAQRGQMLALGPSSWQGGAMEQQPRQSSRAGGAILALTIVAGALIGNHFGQASLGVVIGVGLGIAITVGFYLVDRRRA